jgi:hypothetical protein
VAYVETVSDENDVVTEVRTYDSTGFTRTDGNGKLLEPKRSLNPVEVQLLAAYDESTSVGNSRGGMRSALARINTNSQQGAPTLLNLGWAQQMHQRVRDLETFAIANADVVLDGNDH